MDRIIEVKRKADEINKLLNDKYPSYRFNKLESEEITHNIRELKDYTFSELKKLRKKESNKNITQFEYCFILPALNEFYVSGLHGVNRNSKPTNKIHNCILSASGDLDYWIFEINRVNKNE